MKITIAIPVYNAELYLSQAIKSVLDQSYKEFKLIIINDGSSDNSMKIAREFNDSRIKIINDNLNKGLQYRLNQIIKLTDTPFLARMDADDIMHPERIKKQIEVFEEYPEIDVLGTNAYTIDGDNNVVGIRFIQGEEVLKKVTGFIHPTVMARTSWFYNNLYDENAIRIEDAELWYRTASKYKFMMITEPLLFYREIGNKYYKKYFLANCSKSYILRKYKNNFFWKIFFMKNKFKGIIYWIFNIFGKEKILIKNRNEIIFKKKKNINSLI
ncbi:MULTISPECIES: glycosyltransferase family 2 protein [Elizabethkingia]|uniref:glycosyltransferase family 2 protein n=1 Tax=Elizabethkingia TaxID=308865 RepID=UPI00063A9DB9|nr:MULTISPECIES: glycosyltransferase [Elizabethkingia]AKH95615.1 hypothetical protein M876_13665 [Elizabethkingia anophelis FMS-007]MCT3663407.1 glycosyltransferase [Elizabethkingia anophelis]MCT3673508.1 glycosyltransferase [Elizabethkingia anophelis]MCT3680919.1 glycosyltransferase [Elizabethkingia anophelis]MCT3703475.1 glycosyltransferase [Elizabethkingia anophelis]